MSKNGYVITLIINLALVSFFVRKITREQGLRITQSWPYLEVSDFQVGLTTLRVHLWVLGWLCKL